MVSLDYVNLLSYFLFYFSTGFTVFYSFCLFYYTLCGDFNLTARKIDILLILGFVVEDCGLDVNQCKESDVDKAVYHVKLKDSEC